MSSKGNNVINSNYAIKLENVSKCFQIYDKPHHRLMQGLFRGKKKFFKEFHALNDISFAIKKGETVGIIGRNGAGKSTLLQIICGTLAQTSGNIEINGRIAALLELGAGFNPEFTGRENVYMNGAIIGLSADEIDNRFDDIAAFADIGDFLEQAVKTYSSGMFVRLAFAVNIMSNPEIMIVDEALAVGDMNFQAKCITALTRIQENGATVLFVSHDISSIKSLCSRGIYLERGKVKSIGVAADIAELYVRVMREEMNVNHSQLTGDNKLNELVEIKPDNIHKKIFKCSKDFDNRVEMFRYGTGGARIKYVELLDENGTNIVNAEFDQTVLIKIYFESYLNTSISPNYYILDDKKNLILGASPSILELPLIKVENLRKYIVSYKTKLPLQEGNYSIQFQLNVPVKKNETAEFLDVIDDSIVFQMSRRSTTRIWTKVFVPNSMEVNYL